MSGKRRIVLDLEDGRINGALVQTPLLDLNVPQGTEFGPTVAAVENRVESTQSSAVGHVEITQIQGQEVAFPSVLAVKKMQTHNHPLTLIDVQWNKEWTEIEGRYEEGVRHLRSWSSCQVKGSQIDPGIGMILSLAVSIGTAGTGLVAMAGMNSILTAMGQAAFSALASQAALMTLSTGDLKKTLESMASDAYLKDLAVQVGMAGLVGGGSGGVDLGLLDHLKVSLFRSGVKGLLNMAIKGQDVGSAFKDAVVQGAIDGVGAYAAGQIGKMYDPTGVKDKGLNFVTHKAAHACVGGVMGALISDDAKRGAISGAIGAVAAEIVAETCLKTSAELKQQILKDAEAKGQPLDPKGAEFNEHYQSRLRTQADWAKIAAGVVTLLAGQDVAVSLEAAENALRHNYMIAMTAGLEEQILKEKGDQEALDRLALERQGRGVEKKSQGSRNSSPTRLQDTHLHQAGQKIGEYIPEGVKKGVSQSIEYVNDLIPEPVKNVAGPILEVLDCVPDVAGTLVRRGARAVGVPQGVAQDLGDVVHAGAAFVLPGTAVKTVKATVGVAQEVVGVVKGIRIAPKTIDAQIKWGRGIHEQGMPWEEYLTKQLPADARLPQNFKTFDFFDRKTGIATSAKTLDTTTASRIANPSQTFQTLKKNIDAAAKFEEYRLLKTDVTSDIINVRKLEVAVPEGTSTVQWEQINKAIDYGKSKGVEVNITITQ